MRGSPFLRTLLLAGGLLLAGLVLWRLTREPAVAVSSRPAEQAPPAAVRWGFELKLSSAAESVELKSGSGGMLLRSSRTTGPLLGSLDFDATDDPVVFISIRWAGSGEGNHFAKLTLEPPGKPTQVRYFEAAGDLEDVWELSAK